MAEEAVTLTLEVKDRMTGPLKAADDAVAGLSDSLDDTSKASKPSRFGFKDLGSQLQVVNRMALAGSGAMSRIGKGMGDAARQAVGLGKQAVGSLKSFAGGFTDVGKTASAFVGKLRTVGGQISSALSKAGAAAGRALDLRSHFQMFVSGFRDSTAAANGFTGRMGTIGGKVRGAFDSAVAGIKSFPSKLAGIGSRAVTNITNGFRNLPSGLSRVASRAGEAFRTALSKGLDAARKGAETVGGAIIGVMGTALGGGAMRLVGLENAQAKLRGLGNDAGAVEGIMGDVTKSIEGTTFRLDDAATVAASAVAAGIQPGQELQTMLADVGNAAKAGGVEMSEMGQIFNKVAAFQKADTGDINMIAERGLPIWKKLAESMGVSQDEVKDLASSGKIGFKEFSDAVRLAGGTVAEEMSNTLSGQAANIPAYLSMIGGSLLSGMQPVLLPILKGINSVLAAIAPMLEPVGKALGDALIPVAEKVGAALTALSEGGMDGLVDKLSEFMPVLGPAIGALVAFGTKGVSGALGPLGKFIPVINPVLGAIVGLVAASPELRKALFDMLAQMVPVVLDLLGKIAPVIQTIIGLLVSTLARLVPVLMPLITTIMGVAAVVAGALVSAVTQILPPVLELVAVLIDLVFAVLKPLIPVVSFVAKIIGVVLVAAIKVVAAVVSWLANLLVAVLTPAINWLVSVFEGAAPFLVGVWEWIQQAAGAVADWFTTVLLPAFQAVWDGITAAASWAYNNIIKPIFTGMQIAFLVVATLWTLYWQTILKPVIDGIAAAALWLWNNAIVPAMNGIKAAWQWAINAMQVVWVTVLKPVIDAIGTAITWLKDYIWTPVVNAIQAAWDRVLRGIQNIWNNVLKPVLTAVGTAITFLKDNVWNPVVGAIQSAWSVMADGIQTVKTSVIDPVFDGIKKGVGYVADSFENAKDAIGTAWEKLKELTAAPVRFVVEDVYNKGIRETWNGIAEAVKLDNLKMPKFNLSFASGGVLPGYTPGRDVHHFSSPTAGNLYLSGGESIMRPEFTRAIGGEQGVHRLNQLARSGRTDDVHNVVDHAFAGGGVFPTGPVAGVNAFADSGVWRGLWAIVKDKFPNSRLTSAYRPGSNTASGNRSHHARGNAVDLAGPRSMDTKTMGNIFEFIRGNYGNSNEIIYSPANGRQVKNGRNYMYQGAVRSMHYNHVHWANTRVPAGAPDYVPGGDGGGGGLLSQLFDIGPLKAFKEKFNNLGGGGWGEMLGAAGKNLIDSLVEKISPFQFGDVVAEGGEAISKGAAWAKGQTWAAMKGITGAEKSAMNWLVSKESSWNPRAQNPTTTASGLPQMINSTSRAYLGGAPAKNFGVFEQLNGMRKYVNDRYNGWLGAKAFHQRNNWYKGGGVLPEMLGMPVGLYDHGGIIPGGDAVAVSKTRDPELVSTAAQARAQTDLLRAAADRERDGGKGGDTFYLDVRIEGVDFADHDGMKRAVRSGVEAAFREARERR